MYDDKWWEPLSHRERALFQLWTPLLTMPFGVFHKAVEETLGRSVMTIEFVNVEGLKRELLGQKLAPTSEEIMALIPEDKRILVVVK